MNYSQLGFLAAIFAASTAMAAAPLPAESVQGAVRYLSGGIGQDEAAAFRRAEPHYPLALQFALRARPRDEFLAGVRVLIRDDAGRTVLDTVSEGPYLLAKLPEGRYEVVATQGGVSLERRVRVTEGKSASVGFLWPAA